MGIRDVFNRILGQEPPLQDPVEVVDEVRPLPTSEPQGLTFHVGADYLDLQLSASITVLGLTGEDARRDDAQVRCQQMVSHLGTRMLEILAVARQDRLRDDVVNMLALEGIPVIRLTLEDVGVGLNPKVTYGEAVPNEERARGNDLVASWVRAAIAEAQE